MARREVDLTGSKLHRALREIAAEATPNPHTRQARREAVRVPVRVRPVTGRRTGALAIAALLSCAACTAGPVAMAQDAPAAGPGSALAVLERLPVHPKASMAGYSRDRFGEPWTDDVDVAGGHNGCSTREDILARDLTGELRSGCKVLSGTLADPYTGRTIAFRRGPASSSDVQIDHRVPLANAWVTGAQQLSERERTDLANDPANLQATDGPINQAKGDDDASEWLPPNRAYWCAYVAAQVGVKKHYRLWVTSSERDAMRRVLDTCPDQKVPR